MPEICSAPIAERRTLRAPREWPVKTHHVLQSGGVLVRFQIRERGAPCMLHCWVPPSHAPLIPRGREIAHTRMSSSLRREVLFRYEGWKVNLSRVYRLYR